MHEEEIGRILGMNHGICPSPRECELGLRWELRRRMKMGVVFMLGRSGSCGVNDDDEDDANW